MILSFLNDNYDWYTRMFANLIRDIVEQTEEELITEMKAFWGNTQDAINYIAFSNATIEIEFGSPFW